jgi:ribosomal protein S14
MLFGKVSPKRKVKFFRDFRVTDRYRRMELTRLFFRANNLVYSHRKASLSRVVNRCLLTGSPRTLRYFGLSRQMFRDYFNRGLLPGVRKSSW